MFMNAHLFIYMHVHIYLCHLCILDLCPRLHGHINMQTHHHGYKYAHIHILINIWTNSHSCEYSQKNPPKLFLCIHLHMYANPYIAHKYTTWICTWEGRKTARLCSQSCIPHPSSIPSPTKAEPIRGPFTYQVWQGDMTWSPGKYSFPFQVHGHSSGRKHASPCLSRL